MLYLIRFILILLWLAGLVLSKGFWSTLFALLIPLWAWYLVVEYSLLYLGVV